jgi:hypothetical protein
MLVPRDLLQVPPPTTTDTNFKLYDSCMPYMGMQQKVQQLSAILKINIYATAYIIWRH